MTLVIKLHSPVRYMRGHAPHSDEDGVRDNPSEWLHVLRLAYYLLKLLYLTLGEHSQNISGCPLSFPL